MQASRLDRDRRLHRERHLRLLRPQAPPLRRPQRGFRRRAVDVVVAWAPERLHRSPRELEDFLELLERTGCTVETVKAGTWDVSSSHGRLVARMLDAVSRAESKRPSSPSSLQRAEMMRIAASAAVTSPDIALSHTAIWSASSRCDSRDRS